MSFVNITTTTTKNSLKISGNVKEYGALVLYIVQLK